MTRATLTPEMWQPLATNPAALADGPSMQATRGFWAGVRSRLFRHRPAMAGLVFIIFLVLAAVFGPMASPYSYFEQNLELSNLPPAYRAYTVDADTEVFVNRSNLSLYQVDDQGGLSALLRPDNRDMLNRQSTWQIGDKDVVLDTRSDHPC